MQVYTNRTNWKTTLMCYIQSKSATFYPIFLIAFFLSKTNMFYYCPSVSTKTMSSFIYDNLYAIECTKFTNMIMVRINVFTYRTYSCRHANPRWLGLLSCPSSAAPIPAPSLFRFFPAGLPIIVWVFPKAFSR